MLTPPTAQKLEHLTRTLTSALGISSLRGAKRRSNPGLAAAAGLLRSARNDEGIPDIANLDLADFAATRRGLLLAPLLAALPAALITTPAHAIDPAQTQVQLPDQYVWKPALPSAPPQSAETVAVFGATDKPGPYVVLIKWYPGFMSAPHTYVTDRLCFVISGTWWVNSGEAFEPEATVPVPAGGFVRRVAHTPHYDGVKKGGKEPAVIGIFGEAPILFKATDPSKPLVRGV
jgi:hypothetical protein